MHSEVERMVSDFERGRLSRRELIGGLAAIAAGAAALTRAAGAARQEAGPTFRATGLNHVALDVGDVARASAFYQKHLGLTVMREDTSSAFLRCGDHFLALFRAREAGLNHYCYTIDGYEPAAAVETLRGAGLVPERRGDRVYFKDPDGIEVQVAAPNRW